MLEDRKQGGILEKVQLEVRSLLAKWVILAKLPNITEPDFLVCKVGNNTYLIGHLGRLQVITDIEVLSM